MFNASTLQPGDIVLVWRVSFILPSYFKAKVIRVIGDVVRIQQGPFKWESWVGGRSIEGKFS